MLLHAHVEQSSNVSSASERDAVACAARAVKHQLFYQLLVNLQYDAERLFYVPLFAEPAL